MDYNLLKGLALFKSPLSQTSVYISGLLEDLRFGLIIVHTCLEALIVMRPANVAAMWDRTGLRFIPSTRLISGSQCIR